MLIWIALALQGAPTAVFDLGHVQRPAEAELPVVVLQCQGGAVGDEIVVCGQRRDRYRLPLPNEREQPGDRASGDIPSGMDALKPATRCGIFAGERRCGKREAAQYGYGEGRDPITVLTKLAKKAIDPDD